MEKECLHADYRFLDCDECEDCEIQICVDCGIDITESDFTERVNNE
jgi:hypothetical protein